MKNIFFLSSVFCAKSLWGEISWLWSLNLLSLIPNFCHMCSDSCTHKIYETCSKCTVSNKIHTLERVSLERANCCSSLSCLNHHYPRGITLVTVCSVLLCLPDLESFSWCIWSSYHTFSPHTKPVHLSCPYACIRAGKPVTKVHSCSVCKWRCPVD